MEALQDAIINGLQHIKLTTYSQLASSCVIVFDHLLTLGDEINLIWGSSWSLGKVLFVLNRYYSLTAVIFNSYGLFARTLTDLAHKFVAVGIFIFSSFTTLLNEDKGLQYFKWQGWTGLIGCMLAEAILQMRLYALFSLNKRVLVLMVICFITSTSTSAYVMHYVLSRITASAIHLPTGGMFCVPSRLSPNFYLFWIPILAFETLLCALALFRGFQTFRSGGSLFINGRRLVLTLIRDSVLYFFVIGATYLCSLLVWIFAPVTLLEVPIGFTLAMSCVLANRVVLNVRKASQGVNLTGSQKPTKGQGYHGSLCTHGTLSRLDVIQLRSMGADSQIMDMVESPNSGSFDSRW